MRQGKEFIIVKDAAYADGTHAFHAGLEDGRIWRETFRRDDAWQFNSRTDAVNAMHRFGKHKEGWRVLQSDQI